MPVPGSLLTTAMAVMPHKEVDRALEMALSMDVPFWPQLPNHSYYEDIYVQASEHFPGILLDPGKRTLRFSTERFIDELEGTLAHFDDPEYLDVGDAYSVAYHRFLKLDLSDRCAIHGQLEGPISFGFNVIDEDDRPILFNDSVRSFMLEFMARRVNAQLERLKSCNANAFMFVDEPGLQFLWSAMSGYGDQAARTDLATFFSMIKRPRGIHLCGNPDWDFLLKLDLDLLSLDAYTNAEVFSCYGASIAKFLDRGGVLVWGLVPTNLEPFEKEDITSLIERVQGIWAALHRGGIDRDLLLSQSMLSPATCCLVNPDGGKTVENAFVMVNEVSERLRDKYRLS